MAELRPGHWRCPVCSETPVQERVFQRLRQHRGNQARLRIVQQQLEAWTELAAARVDGGGGHGHGPSDPTGGRATTRVELEQERLRLRMAITQVDAGLGVLDETELAIVTMACIDRMPVADVAAEVNMTRRHVYRVRNAALDRMAPIVLMSQIGHKNVSHRSHTD